MYYTGFADEASGDLALQIKATKELGWEYIETRKLFDSNMALCSDEEFDKACEMLDEAGVKFNCFGSGIGNWAKPITEPPESSYDELKKAIPRLQKLNIKYVRIMSFACPQEIRENLMDYKDEAIKRVSTMAKMAEDAGILLLHENCNAWGGMSYEHTLCLLDGVNSPNFKLVFDTGNPVFEPDIRGEAPYSMQDSWEFYTNVKEFIEYVHIKDAKQIDGKTVYTFAGEGDGYVRPIVTDLLKNGYDGGFSMEPHMAMVFHDESQNKAELSYANYVEYGQKFSALVDEIKQELGQ